MVRIETPPGIVSGESVRDVQKNKTQQTAAAEMKKTVRKRWSKVAGTTKDGDRSPLSLTERCLLNHGSTGPTQSGSTTDRQETHSERQNGVVPSDGPEVQNCKSPRKSGEVLNSVAFGRHSAARQSLRSRGSLSKILSSSKTHIGPSKSRSIPNLRDKREMQINSGGLDRSQGPTDIETQAEDTASAFLNSASLSLRQKPVKGITNKSTQTQFHDTACAKSIEIPLDVQSPKDFLGHHHAEASSDTVHVSSLNLGISKPSAFQNIQHRTSYNSTSNMPVDYDMDDLRRIVSTEVSIQWGDLQPLHPRELFHIHTAFIQVIREISSERLQTLMKKIGSDQDWRGPHEIMFREDELCEKLLSRLYRLPRLGDFDIRPAGLLRSYLVTVDFLHRGKKPQRGMNAMWLAAAFVENDAPRSVGDFAVVSMPDAIFLGVSSPKLYVGDAVEFTPLYLAQSPFQPPEQDQQVKYSIDLAWLSWCDESSSFKGKILSNGGQLSSSDIADQCWGHVAVVYPLVVTVKAVVRFQSASNDQNQIPVVEKRVTTKVRFEVHRKASPATTLKGKGPAVFMKDGSPIDFEEYQIEGKPLENLIAPELQEKMSSEAMALRPQNSAPLPMKSSLLMKQYSNVARDLAQSWNASPGLGGSSLTGNGPSSGWQTPGESQRHSSQAKGGATFGNGTASPGKVGVTGIDDSIKVDSDLYFSVDSTQKLQAWQPGTTSSLSLPEERTESKVLGIQDENQRTSQRGSMVNGAPARTLPNGVNHLDPEKRKPLTPPTSPGSPPNKPLADVHIYFHPNGMLSPVCAERVECPGYPWEAESETNDGEGLKKGSTKQHVVTRATQTNQDGIADGLHKHKGKASPSSKGRPRRHGAYRSEGPGPSPLGKVANHGWDVDDYAGTGLHQANGAIDRYCSGYWSSSDRHANGGYHMFFEPDVKLSADEARQIAFAMEVSRNEEKARKLSIRKISDNYDDLFVDGPESEEEVAL